MRVERIELGKRCQRNKRINFRNKRNRICRKRVRFRSKHRCSFERRSSERKRSSRKHV